jgi:hypothetical protein
MGPRLERCQAAFAGRLQVTVYGPWATDGGAAVMSLIDSAADWSAGLRCFDPGREFDQVVGPKYGQAARLGVEQVVQLVNAG